jgi:hypothetical protein
MHGNATAAFIGAHPRAANWKRRSAGRKAVELMKRPAVQARVDVFQTAMLEQSNASLIAHLGVFLPIAAGLAMTERTCPIIFHESYTRFIRQRTAAP